MDNKTKIKVKERYQRNVASRPDDATGYVVARFAIELETISPFGVQ